MPPRTATFAVFLLGCSSGPALLADATRGVDAPPAALRPSRDAVPAGAPTPPTAEALTGVTLLDGWTDPRALAAPVNTTGWEDSAYISADGTRLYFAYSQYNYVALQSGHVVADGPQRPGEIRPGFEIYEATVANGAWSVNASTASSTSTDVSEASVGVDDAERVLALVRYDGTPQGGDLYLTHGQSGAWQPAQALPSPINTACIDDNAALSRDGNTLYFDSNRVDASGVACKSDTGAGGRTIYATTWNGGSWSTPAAVVGGPNSGLYHWQVSPRQDPVMYWTGHDSDCPADSCIYHATRQIDGSYGKQTLVLAGTPAATGTVGQVVGVGEVSVTDDGHWMYFVYILKTATTDASGGLDLNIGVAFHP